MNTCRFCGHSDYDRGEHYPLVKYGVRHYAHADCGLKAKGVAFLDSLTDWQCTRFPYRAAQDFGLLPALMERCERYESQNP